jgi:hypothetical protein
LHKPPSDFLDFTFADDSFFFLRPSRFPTTNPVYATVGVVDFIKPSTENTGAGIDFRDATLDIFFVVFGVILAISTIFQKLYYWFGFLRTSFGVGFTLILCGFLVVKSFDILLYQTYVGAISFAAGILFLVDGIVSLFSCCDKKGEAAPVHVPTAEEQAKLLGGEEGNAV